ncbi:YidC/Oxa1 family membrane protein insertase [Treponema zioleckii]|uniref:YidC/Oxa1 family membrane protein insertase n=1 Tax=Treponema zioleckii TaxID=331680 RepID=UPI00168B1098|nr:YidC/Oxa1 family membrane protein insertase [Treponema zioleckii]
MGSVQISTGGELPYSINLLPILMTLINFVSGVIYLKKAPLKEKIQLYALALVFLFILYDSPSGLVCYWILNNTFSLFKNLVNAKVKNPRRLVHLVISGILLLASIFILAKPNYALAKRLALVGFSMLVAFLPVCMGFARRLLNKRDSTEVSTSHHDSGFSIFILSALGLALLAGFLLPSGIIATSPVEFSFVGNTDSPLVARKQKEDLANLAEYVIRKK